MHKINEQGHVSFKESISDFFHGLVDFKGITTRRGYLFPMIYYYGILLTGLIWCILFMFVNTLNLGAIFIWFIVISNYIFSNLAIIPVTVRRFRDIGFNMFVTVIMLIFGLGVCPFFGIILPTNCFSKNKQK